MFPIIVAPLDDSMLALPVHILRTCANRKPDILKGGVSENNNQLRQILVYRLDLFTGIRQHLVPILGRQFLFRDAGIINVLCSSE